MSAKIYQFPKPLSKPRTIATKIMGELESEIGYLTPAEQVNTRLLVAADILVNAIVNDELGDDPIEFLNRFSIKAVELAQKHKQGQP